MPFSYCFVTIYSVDRCGKFSKNYGRTSIVSEMSDFKSKHFGTVRKIAEAFRKLPKTMKCRPLFVFF